MKPDREPISDQIWEGIRAEFTLPSLGQVRRRLSELMEDPEPVMQQLVRVFLSGLLSLGATCSVARDDGGYPDRFPRG